MWSEAGDELVDLGNFWKAWGGGPLVYSGVAHRAWWPDLGSKKAGKLE